MPPSSAGAGVVLRALALIGGAPGVTEVLESALDELAGAVGASAAAFFVGDTSAGGLVARCRRPADWGSDPDDVVVSARLGGQAIGAVGLALAPGATLSAGDRTIVEGVAQALALAVRNDDLVRGLGDRVRELDRQALHLTALTRAARRVAETLDEGDAQRVVVSEARALLHADTAALLIDGDDGLAIVAVEGPDAITPDAADLADLVGETSGRRRDRDVVVAVPSRGPTASDARVLIAVSRSRGAPFTDGDLGRLRELADQASVALSIGRLLSGLRHEQAQRRALAASIVLAQECERRRVAEDLHDGPVQELVGVGLMLDALSADLGSGSPEIVADINRAAAAAREAVRALRRAISDLHPMAIEELGFTAAIRSLVERIEWRGARVDLDLGAADSLSETNRTLAFRIVQEGVANIVRHAEPSLVTIVAARQGGLVVIEIRDDGRGFDPDDARPGAADGHLGLAAAQERAALVGGRLTVTSSRGSGTALTLSLPALGGEPLQVPGVLPDSRASAAASASASANRSSTTT